MKYKLRIETRDEEHAKEVQKIFGENCAKDGALLEYVIDGGVAIPAETWRYLEASHYELKLADD